MIHSGLLAMQRTSHNYKLGGLVYLDLSLSLKVYGNDECKVLNNGD